MFDSAKQKTIYAIIGAGGFLGQHLLHLLLKNEPEVFIKIIDKAPSIEALRISFPSDFTSSQVETHWGVDISDEVQLDGILRGVTTIFHLAAAIAYGRKNKKMLHKTNVDGVKKVIQYAKQEKVKKIVYVSSFATIGCLDHERHHANETCENNWDEEPYAHYGWSKFQAEQYALDEASHDLHIVVAAPGIMFGPGPGHHASILPFLVALKNKWLIMVPHGGTNIIDVRDVANGLILLSHPQHREGKYLLVAHNIKHHDLLSFIVKAVNRNLRILVIPQFFAPLLGFLAHMFEAVLPPSSPLSKEGLVKAFKFRYFTNQKAVNTLGWSPQFTLEDTLRDTLEWIREN